MTLGVTQQQPGNIAITGDVEAVQPTHDDLNCNATIQVGDVDVSEANPVPTTREDPFDISVTPTITAGLYAAGDALGGRLEFANAARVASGGGTITKVVITDDDSEEAPVDIVFFDQAFTATADNAPFDPSDADLQNCIGFIDVAATDFATFNDNSAAAKASGLRMPFDFDLAAAVTTLYAQMVVRSTPTYTATDDLTVIITVQRY